MGERAGFWYAFYALVSQYLLLGLAGTTLVPFTLRAAGAELERREPGLLIDALRPRYEVELHYGSENSVGQQYVAVATTRHDSWPYVLVEGFENLLSMVKCSSHGPNITHIAMTFRNADTFALARDAWSRHDSLTFITHHASCNNNFEQREVYISSAINFHDQDLTVVASCRPTVFGPSTDASSSLSFRGGIAPDELSQRLRPREFEGQRHIAKRDIPAFTFAMEETFGPREFFFGLGGFELSCIDCKIIGEVATSFNFHMPNTDWMSHLSEGITPENFDSLFGAMEVRIETTREIEANLNLELVSDVDIKFTYPGLTAGGTPKLGKKMVKKKKKKLFEFGRFNIAGTYRYGVSLGAEIESTLRTTLPLTATVPVGQGVTMNFLDPWASSSSLFPNINIRTPELSLEDPVAKFSVGVGPGVELTLEALLPMGELGTAVSVTLQGGIEVPKIETSFSTDENVDGDCKPGAIANAVRERTKLGVGLKLEAWSNVQREGYLIPRAPLKKWDLGHHLHPNWILDNRCFDASKLLDPKNWPSTISGFQDPSTPDVNDGEPAVNENGEPLQPGSGSAPPPSSPPHADPIQPPVVGGAGGDPASPSSQDGGDKDPPTDFSIDPLGSDKIQTWGNAGVALPVAPDSAINVGPPEQPDKPSRSSRSSRPSRPNRQSKRRVGQNQA